jgi:2-amino-4-hydroxy-6-hydroxymethyldihydropteridine diphosphokinase
VEREHARPPADAAEEEAGASADAPVGGADERAEVWTRLEEPAERPVGPVVAYVALGSNLGDRLSTLRAAVRRLGAAPGVRVAAVSPVYEAAAHTLAGQAPQPDFLNAVARLETGLEPAALLHVLLEVEETLGRRRAERWAARPLDLDLLLYGDRVIEEPGLHVPHPRLPERRFVLAPLADLAPDLPVPGAAATVGELLARCPDAAPLARTALRLLP